MTLRSTSLALALGIATLLPLAACSDQKQPPEIEAQVVEDHGHSHGEGEMHVQCGCAIESVGTCGEWIEVDGEMVALVLPDGLDLGAMPFCGKDGLVAKAEGEVQDGKYVATSFALLGE